MARDENLKEGTVVAGRYRIERPLGEGGMSTVYAVRHVHTGERLAMKILRDAGTSDLRAVELFRREMRAPAQIESEHVVRVTDADVAPDLGNAPFMVMELLRGRDLQRELLERGPLPAPEVLLYLTQAARALDKAHKLGIVHRDLKPENLFLTRREDGTPWVKVLDFGIAKIDPGAAEGVGAIGTTAAGEVFGTPLYMAPEQARGDNDRVGPWTDIWALGVITHKLLTGKDIWQPRSLAHLVSVVAFEPIQPPSALGSTLGPGFDAWFLRCCAREPEERFSSARDAVAALAEALGEKVADPRTLARLELVLEETSSLRLAGGLGAREPQFSATAMTRTDLGLPAKRSGWLIGAPLAAALAFGGLLLALRGAPTGEGERYLLTLSLHRVRAAAAAAGALPDAKDAKDVKDVKDAKDAPPAQPGASGASGAESATPGAESATPGADPTHPAATPRPAPQPARTRPRKKNDPMLDIRD